MNRTIIFVVLGLMVVAAIAAFFFMSGDTRRKRIGERLAQAAPAQLEIKTADVLRPEERRDPVVSFLPGPIGSRLEAALEATGNRIIPLHLMIAALLGGFGMFALFGWLLKAGTSSAAGAGVVMGLIAPWMMLRRAHARHNLDFLNLFPDAIDLIVRAVKAGLPVTEAIGVVGKEIADPVGLAFRRVSDELRIGVGIEEALHRAADRIRISEFRFFVASISLQRETGGNLAETFTNLGQIIRRRKELRMKGKALTSEARAAAMVIAALPLFAGGALSLFSPDYIMLLLTDPRGGWVIGIALGSLTLGIVVMNTIIKKTLA